MSHLLVVANETVDAPTLREALAAHGDDVHATVVSPVNEPKRGYVVYTDTRRASARRRLERALGHLREAGVPADGYVVEADPAAAVRDALVVHCLHRGTERVGMRDLAVRVDPLATQLSEGALQPPFGLGMVTRRWVALRRHDEEAGRACSSPLADLRQERLADHRLVRDHEDVLLVGASGPRDEVLDRHVTG